MAVDGASKTLYRTVASHVPRLRFGLRVAAARLVAGCVVLAIVACEPGDSPGSLDPDSLRVQVGTAGLVAPDRWNFVHVTARASSGVFRGRVRIRGFQPLSRSPLPESFSGDLEVGTETQTAVFAVLLRGAASLAVDIRGPGLPAGARRELDLVTEEEPCYRILEISGARAPSANALARSIHAWLQFPEEDSPGHRESRVQVGRARPEELPSNLRVFDVADLVVLSDLSVFESSPEVLAALVDWVRKGGCVVGIPGPSWTLAPRLSKEILEMFGIAGPPRVETDPARLPTQDPAGALYSFVPRTGTSRDESSLLFEHAFGSGSASFLRYAPSRDLLASSSADRDFRASVESAWRRVVLGSWTRIGLRARVLNGTVEPLAMRALHGYSGFTYPAWQAVLVFVLVYLGVGFYLSACVFAYFKKLEWAYVFMLVVAVAASVGIYHFGLVSAIQTRTVDSITVARLRAGASGIADGAIFYGIASPARSTVSLEGVVADGIPSQPRLVRSDENRMGSGGAAPALPRVLPLEYETSARGVRIDGLELYPNATTYLRIDREFDLGGGISVRRTPEGLVVDNRTRYSLDCHIVEAGRIIGLGEVAAGVTPVLRRRGYSLSSRDWSHEETIPRALARALLVEFSKRASSSAPRSSGVAQVLARVTAGYAPPASGLGAVRHGECFLILDVEGAR